MQDLRSDFYQVLGVPQFSEYNEVRHAFRDALRKYHPDVTKETDKKLAEAKTKEINDAWFILGKPDIKAKYDNLLKDQATTKEQYSEFFSEMDKKRKEEEEKLNDSITRAESGMAKFLTHHYQPGESTS